MIAISPETATIALVYVKAAATEERRRANGQCDPWAKASHAARAARAEEAAAKLEAAIAADRSRDDNSMCEVIR